MNWLGSLIPKHLVPMRTVFRSCFLVNFAVHAQVMQRLLPEPIQADLCRGEAYLSIVIACMDRMRPAFVPRSLGLSFNQVVYRVVVSCQGERGVHFLRSDADSRLMCWGGNLATFFRFHYACIVTRQEGTRFYFDLTAPPGECADIHATYELAQASRTLPSSSPFAGLQEAQDFLVELYAAFAVDSRSRQLQTLRIERGDWDISVVPDLRCQYQFMQSGPLFSASTTRLDSIFYVHDLPYHWHTLQRSAC